MCYNEMYGILRTGLRRGRKLGRPRFREWERMLFFYHGCS